MSKDKIRRFLAGEHVSFVRIKTPKEIEKETKRRESFVPGNTTPKKPKTTPKKPKTTPKKPKTTPKKPKTTPKKKRVTKKTPKRTPMTKAEMIEWYENTVSPHARMIDESIKAKTIFKNPTAEEIQLWMNNTNRYDIQGIDTPGGYIKEPVVEEVVKPSTKKTATRPRSKRKKQTYGTGQDYGYSSSWWAEKERNLKHAESMNDLAAMESIIGEMANAARMESTGDEGYNEDMLSFLQDDAYGEIADDHRWKYDRRDTIEAYHRKQAEALAMQEYNYGYRKRSSRSVRKKEKERKKELKRIKKMDKKSRKAAMRKRR